MLTTYATGLAGVVLVAVGWIAVQEAWRRTFPERLPDAGALGCFGCARTERCENREAGGACRREEERS